MGKKTFRVGVSEGLRKKNLLGIILLAVAAAVTVYVLPKALFLIREFDTYYVNGTPLSRYGYAMLLACVVALVIFCANLLAIRATRNNIPTEIVVSGTALDIAAFTEYHFTKADLQSVSMSKAAKRGCRKLTIVTTDGRTLTFSLGLGKSMFQDAVLYQYAELWEALCEWCDKNEVAYL